VDPPAIDRQRYLGERALPGEHVRVDGVDERAVEIEDERPLSPRQAQDVIGSAVLPGVEIDVVDPPRGGARQNELERDGIRCEDSGQIRQQEAEPGRRPGPLTPEERGIMNARTIEGEKMLKQVGGLLGEVGNLVRVSSS